MFPVAARFLAVVCLFMAINIYGKNYKKLQISWDKNEPDAEEVLQGDPVKESAKDSSASDESGVSKSTTSNKNITEPVNPKRVSLKRARGYIQTTESSVSETPVISKVFMSIKKRRFCIEANQIVFMSLLAKQ
jgi:hypothetical protein